MAKIKFPLLLVLKSPVRCAGLVFVLMLYGCQTTAPPDQVALKFWQDLAQGQIAKAKSHTTEETQAFVNINDIDKLSPIRTGEAFVDEDNDNAAVLTTINRDNKPVTFNTVLRNEQDGWKVDFQQTHTNIAMMPFNGIVRSLQSLGITFAKQLEQQLPQIEKELKSQLPLIEKEMKSQLPLIEREMETLANEMKKQIEQFGRTIKKHPIPPLVKPNTSAQPKSPGMI